MSHDAEAAAAAFLGGAMSPQERSAHEEHLLVCDDCWHEVDLGRRGRSLVEGSRELAPPGLRERLRAEVTEAASAMSPPAAVPTQPRRRQVLALAAAVALLASVAGATQLGPLLRPSSEPSSLAGAQGTTSVAEAVARYRDGRLPGDTMPALAVPDLARIGLHPVGAAAGELGGESVTGFAYADDTGRRVVVYLSENPFPRVTGAEQISGTDGPWIARSDGVVLLCARLPHAMLLVGQDVALVRSAAVELDAI